MQGEAIFAVRLGAFLRVAPFVSKEETRYYLNGITVEAAPDGAVCAATDGHRLGVRYDKEGWVGEKAIVKVFPEMKVPKGKGLFRAPWLVGVKTKGPQGYVAIVEPHPTSDQDTAASAIDRVEDCLYRFGRALIDGTFPDWRRVVPTPSDSDVVRSYNANYVKAFGHHMTMRSANADAPNLIEVGDDPLFLGVLMPVRVTSKGKLPEWLQAPVEAVADQKKAA